MRSFLATVSLALNRISGGERGQYLCARIAERWGADCLFCKLVGLALGEPEHCQSLLDEAGKK